MFYIYIDLCIKKIATEFSLLFIVCQFVVPVAVSAVGGAAVSHFSSSSCLHCISFTFYEHFHIWIFFSLVCLVLFLYFIGFWRVTHSLKCSHCLYCSYCTHSLLSFYAHSFLNYILCSSISISISILFHPLSLSLFLAFCLCCVFGLRCFGSMLFMFHFWLTISNDTNNPIFKRQLLTFILYSLAGSFCCISRNSILCVRIYNVRKI